MNCVDNSVCSHLAKTRGGPALRGHLCAGVSLWGLMIAGLAAAAHAPQPARAEGPQVTSSDIETVTVTGQRAANTNAIKIKRDAERVLDSVSADDIGSLPDFNAGDALKRLPGVNVTLYQGEPRFVTVRGFAANYTTVTIDGFTLASPDPGGRQIFMEVMPSDIAAHMDVLKSARPDSDGHMLGGAINFVTPSALSMGSKSLVASLKGGANLQDGIYGGTSPTGEGDVRAAHRFGDRDQFGLIVSGSYWLRNLHIPQISVAPTIYFFDAAGNPAPTYGGNGIAAPGQRQWYNYTDNRDRHGFSSRFDWDPSTHWNGHISAFTYRQHEAANRNDTTAQIAATAKNLNQTPTTGTLTSASQVVQLARLRFTRELYGTNAQAAYHGDNGWTGDVKAGWSQATLNNPQIFDNFTQSGLAFQYDMSPGYPLLTPTNAANYNNLSLYKLNYHRTQESNLLSNVYDIQGNLGFNAETGDHGFGAKAGAKWLRTTQNLNYAQNTWTGSAYTLADISAGGRTCSIGCVQDGIFLIQPNLADSIFGQNRAKLAQAFDPTTFYGNTYDVTEDISAGYGLVRFGAEKWRAVAGLRYESTGLSSNGYLQTNGAWNRKTNTSETGYALPSLNASADTGNFLPVLGDGQVRFAYGRTLGRPRFDAIATHGGVLNTTTSPFTLTQGNASLRPLTADNFDVSHEWYADNGRGLFAIGLFYKQIHDAIFNYGQTESQTINGVTVPVLVSQYRNATDLTRVQGLEVSFTRDFTFLPAPFDGLGISGNATFMQTHAPVHLGDGSVVIMNRLPQQANNILNLSLYYESDRFHGRIAWNHTGTEWDDRFSFLGSAAAFYQNRYVRPLDYLDISIAYDIAPQFTVSASVINATGTDVLYGFGRSQEAIHDVIGFAPSVLLGISCKF